MTTRPIPDRVKESLFGLLRGHVQDSTVFDAFAGSGAFGLEAISRGASRCVFVEKDRSAAELLKRNIAALGVEDRCDLVVGDALGPGALSRCPRPATIVFLDPPYPLVRDVVGWKRVKIQFERLITCLSDDGFGIMRTPWPFVQLVEEGAPPAEEQEEEIDGGKGKGKGKNRRDRADRGEGRGGRSERVRSGKLRDDELEIWSIERDAGRGAKELTEEEIERMDVAEAASAVEAGEQKNVQKVIPDLSIPGAVGPETHLYGTMAVHLYQRAK